MNSSKRKEYRALVFLGVLLCGLLLTGCGERRSKQYTAIGDTQLRLGHLEEAREAYEKALGANPRNPGALLGLARAHRVKGNDADALEAYQKAREIDPSAAAAYVEPIDVLIKAGREEEARTLAAAFAEKDPERGGVLLARIEAQAGETDSALRRLETLREKVPNSALVRVAIATLYTAAGRYAEAEKELDDVLESIDPDSLSAHMARVDVFARQGKVDEMLAELQAFAKRKPDNIGVQLAYARALLMAGRLDEAEEAVRPIVEARPDNGWANFVLGECLVKKGDYESAIVCLQAARQTLPEEKAVQELLQVALRHGEGATETTPVARQPIQQPLASPPRVEDENDWRSLWRQARLRELLSRVDDLRSREPDSTPFLVAAALLLNRVEQAKTLAESLPENTPMRDVLRLLESGKADDLFAFFETWSEKDPLQADLRDNVAAYGFALAGRRTAAIRLLAQALAARPEYILPLLHSAVIYRQASMPEFHIAALRRMASLCPRNIDAQAALCEALWGADRPEDALTQAQALFAAFPDNPETLRLLAKAYREVNDLDSAVRALHSALEKIPDDAGLRVQLAEIEIMRGASENTRNLLSNEAQEGPLKDAAEFLQIVMSWQQGDLKDATAVWQAREQMGATQRVPLATRFACAAAFVGMGDVSSALNVLLLPADTSSKAKDRIAAARYALGDRQVYPPESDKTWLERLATDKESLSQFLFANALIEGRLELLAKDTLNRLEERLGSAKVLNALAIRCWLARGAGENTLENLRLFAEKHKEDPAVWLAVAGVAQKKANATLEEEAIQKALALSPESPEVWAAAADFYDRRRDFTKAVEANRKLLAIVPDRPEVQNNLAYSILKANGDVQEALNLAKAASEQLKTNPYVLHTLGLAYRKAGDYAEAQRLLAAALELRPGDPELLYDFGKTLMDSGKKAEGLRHVELAVLHARQFEATFPSLHDAEDVLRQEADSSRQNKSGGA